ncbi:unnamed protein product [Amoebophrya sp. A25]|nr:unnamed protein product [Amoebophrya sp. A25]|eukprot:GSA25T00008120001.1
MKLLTTTSLLFSATSSIVGVFAGKKCPGHFGGATKVANMCESHFPDKNSEKIWFIKFYAPWCGHCNSMKQAWSDLAKELADDKEIGIGGVDCDDAKNKGLCGKYGVQGFPTLKAFINGKPKNYQGAREKGPMKSYILGLKAKKGSKGGSAKCNKGIFKSSLKDSVLPLCDKHFPDQKSKFSWVIAFYNKASFDTERDEYNRLALEFGNEPADKNKSLKSNKKQSERLTEIKEKYSLAEAEDGKRKAGKSKDPLAKFGGVCCDCEKEADPKCKDIAKLPAFQVFNHVSKKTFTYEADKWNVDGLTGFALEKLELVTKAKEKEQKKEAKKEKDEL